MRKLPDFLPRSRRGALSRLQSVMNPKRPLRRTGRRLGAGDPVDPVQSAEEHGLGVVSVDEAVVRAG